MHKVALQESDLTEIFAQFPQKKILVVGDLMLDFYLWGKASRISPEAPVPVVDIERSEYRLGGAANVVHNIYSLGAIPMIVGVVGDDHSAQEFYQILDSFDISESFLVKDVSRPTTVKSRIFANNQQVMRYDLEKKQDINQQIEKNIIKNLDSALKSADALVLQDYNKGVLTPKIIRFAIKKAKEKGIPITVDPKVNNFCEYKSCTVLKPNLVEVKKNYGQDIVNDKDLKKAARELCKKLSPEYLIITLSEKGLVIFDKEENVHQIPTFAKEVYDVSGAGDTVISVLSLCLSCGVDIITSTILANHAAGAVCGKRGINPATVEDILLSFRYHKFSEDNIPAPFKT